MDPELESVLYKWRLHYHHFFRFWNAVLMNFPIMLNDSNYSCEKNRLTLSKQSFASNFISSNYLILLKVSLRCAS